MGNCCAVPQTFDEDVKGRHKSNPFSVDYDDQAIPKGGYKLKSRVLDNPTGHDIEEFYEVGRELGRGEFGVTYLCTDKSNREVFACKSISKIKLRTRVDIEDVKREVEIMKRLPNHPNIVSLKDTYEDNNGVHLVMELCEGGELFDRIVTRGHYTERAAAAVTRTIVEVIQVKTRFDYILILFCALKSYQHVLLLDFSFLQSKHYKFTSLVLECCLRIIVYVLNTFRLL